MNQLPWATPDAIGALTLTQLLVLYHKPDRKPITPAPDDDDQES